MPPPDLRARVLAAAQREPTRTHAAGVRARALAVVIGFGCSLAAVALLGPKLGGRPAGYVALVLAAWAAIAGLATWAGVARGRSMLGRPMPWRVVASTLTPAILLAVALAGSLLWPALLAQQAGLGQHLECHAFTILFALGPLVAFAVIRRGSDPIAPRVSGAAIGAAAGAWGAVAIAGICRCGEPSHVLFGHVLPVAVLALLGLLLGDRVVAVRARNG
jgi:hypothetical protein